MATSMAFKEYDDFVIDEDPSEEEMAKALKASLQTSLQDIQRMQKSQNLPSRPPSQAQAQAIGLEAVADRVHPDFSKLSEDEQLQLAMKESALDALSEQEKIKLALEESMKVLGDMKVNDPANPNEEDEELRKALEKSLDPNEQENYEYRQHFQKLQKSDLDSRSIPDLEDLEETRSRTSKPPKTLMSQRIAAKFPTKEGGFFNELQFESELLQALEQSKKEVNARSMSLSPTHSNGYAHVAKAQASSSSSSGSNSAATIVQARSQTPPSFRNQTSKVKSRKGQYRPMVVDGCNIGFAYGLNDKFDARGLEIVFNHFISKGYEQDDIIIVMKHIPLHYLTEEDKQIINSFKSIGVITESSSRRVGNEIIKSDDDLLILKTAKTFGGIVLSNDMFRKEYDITTEYRDVIKYRLLRPNFIKDRLLLPDDPLGKKGPKLDDFLRFDK